MDITKEYCEFLSSSENEVLATLFEQGIIDIADVAKAMYTKKEKYVEAIHTHTIYYQESHNRWVTRVRDPIKTDGKRKQIARATREDLIEALYDFYTDGELRKRLSTVSISGLFDDWIEHKRLHGISESTILKYQSDWRCHLAGTQIVKKPIKLLTRMELDEWAHRMIKDNNMTRTDYINVATLVRQPLDYAVDLEIISANPMHNVKIDKRMFKPVRKKSSETQVFSREECAKLKQIALDDMNNPKLVYKLAPLAFLFMFQTALRIGEACTVKFSDIEGNELHLQRTYQRDIGVVKDGLKGVAVERWIPLSKEAKEIIAEAKRIREAMGVVDDGYIFSTNEDCLSYRALSDCFARYCDKAGVEYRSSHKVRKTVLSALLDAGMNINTVREIAGHADEQTTLNSYCYDRSNKDHRLDIMEKALSC